MVRLGRGVAVISHQASDDGLLMLAQAGNIRMANQVFAVLVVPARIHRHADIMQKSAEFQRDALRGGKFVNWRQLIEKLGRQAAHMFAMPGI